MNPIDKYRNRMRAYGEDVHDETYSREARMLQMKMRNTLSYQEIKIWSCEDGVDIDDEDRRKLCKSKRLAVINSDNLNEKYIYSLPGEDIEHGSLIYWMNNYWLVTEKDANMTVYTRATMIQCNHLLKWVAEDGVVHRQWCIVEDGTKYLTGEYEDKYFIVTRGDSRIYLTIARNRYTIDFVREHRFLIDDDDAPNKIAYLLSKPLKLGWTFNGKGVYKFVLQEVQSTIYDNQELGIADYYKYYPRDDGELLPQPDEDREGWI